MTEQYPALTKFRRPLLAGGVLCLALLLSACGGDDDHDNPTPPPGDGDGGNPPATCTASRCAPAP